MTAEVDKGEGNRDVADVFPEGCEEGKAYVFEGLDTERSGRKEKGPSESNSRTRKTFTPGTAFPIIHKWGKKAKND